MTGGDAGDDAGKFGGADAGGYKLGGSLKLGFGLLIHG